MHLQLSGAFFVDLDGRVNIVRIPGAVVPAGAAVVIRHVHGLCWRCEGLQVTLQRGVQVRDGDAGRVFQVNLTGVAEDACIYVAKHITIGWVDLGLQRDRTDIDAELGV